MSKGPEQQACGGKMCSEKSGGVGESQGPPFVPMSTGAVSDPGFPEPEPDGDTLAAQFQSKGTKGSCLCDYQEMGGKPPPQPLSAPGSWPSQGLGQEKEATC